jgi:hypothetical protein
VIRLFLLGTGFQREETNAKDMPKLGHETLNIADYGVGANRRAGAGGAIPAKMAVFEASQSWPSPSRRSSPVADLTRRVSVCAAFFLACLFFVT